MTSQNNKAWFAKLRLGDLGRSYVIRAHLLRRRILRFDERLRENYLRSAVMPKLHIGGGWRRLDGWLDADLELIPGVMRMDATKGFPFGDEVFQYIYTEHMIEHVPYEGAASMLRECYRVLRKEGVIRVVTPNFAAITGLYKGRLSSDQEKYLEWFCETFVPKECPKSAVSVVNTMFRSWGHQFIYDEDTLGKAMLAAGFGAITRCTLGKSDQAALMALENERRYPEGLLDFESVALEGRK